MFYQISWMSDFLWRIYSFAHSSLFSIWEEDSFIQESFLFLKVLFGADYFPLPFNLSLSCLNSLISLINSIFSCMIDWLFTANISLSLFFFFFSEVTEFYKYVFWLSYSLAMSGSITTVLTSLSFKNFSKISVTFAFKLWGLSMY